MGGRRAHSSAPLRTAGRPGNHKVTKGTKGGTAGGDDRRGRRVGCGAMGVKVPIRLRSGQASVASLPRDDKMGQRMAFASEGVCLGNGSLRYGRVDRWGTGGGRASAASYRSNNAEGPCYGG